MLVFVGLPISSGSSLPTPTRGINGPGDFMGFLAMLNQFPYEQTVLVPEEGDEEMGGERVG